MDQTIRHRLPLLASGQAQKEITHNEALALIDIALGAQVVSAGVATPPAEPLDGQAWIVGEDASGAWDGQDGAIAAWTPGGWRFLAAPAGTRVWIADIALPARRTNDGWAIGEIRGNAVLIGGVPVVGAQRPAIADPAGGGTIDAEARSAIAGILAALASHGLIAP